MVLWSVLTNDVEGATRAMVRRRVLKGTDDGAIILMHSGVQSTLDVLPELAAELRRRGYHFVTVSTMLGLPAQNYDRMPAPVQTAQASASPPTSLPK